MSLPKDGGLTTSPPAVAALTPSGDPCPAGPDVPREGSRDIQNRGKVISVPHDWCKSTDSPVPYKIWCWQSDAGNLANSVRQTDCRSHVQGSYVRECYGDEPGKGGGVKSGTCQAECTPMTWSSSVRAEGRPMVRRFDKWHMNHGNTWGCLENPEDTGNYNAPKVPLIKSQLSPPIASREDDIQAAAQGTKVAGDNFVPIDPGVEDKDEEGLSIKSQVYRAKKLFLQAATKTPPWLRVTPASPCYKYRCGKIPSKYRGGAYGCVGGHHMPADSVSPLPRDAGPAIQMDDEDHKATASNGTTPTAAMYRGLQLHLILNQDFMGANRMDVIDVDGKNPNGKYTDAMGQMADYLLCLKRNRLIR